MESFVSKGYLCHTTDRLIGTDMQNAYIQVLRGYEGEEENSENIRAIFGNPMSCITQGVDCMKSTK